MLNFDEHQRLTELKKELTDQLGVIDHEFTDEEVSEILKEIEKIPKSERTLANWQDAVKKKTSLRSFRFNEALEFSDIDFLHKQIQEILKKEIMPKPTITEFENLIDAEKKEYVSALKNTLAMVRIENDPTKALDQMTELHIRGVSFFNLFERSIDEYGLHYFELNEDTKNRKIEDAISITNTIFTHWKTIRMIAEKYKISCPTPTPTAYSSIQRILKHFEKNKINELREKFMAEKLPTNGFDSTAKFSGWKIGGKKLTVTQIIIGSVMIIAVGIIVFNKEHLTGMQYMFSRLILCVGITLIGSAMIEALINITWTIAGSFTLKAAGWAALFYLLYFRNPPGAPHEDASATDSLEKALHFLNLPRII